MQPAKGVDLYQTDGHEMYKSADHLNLVKQVMSLFNVILSYEMFCKFHIFLLNIRQFLKKEQF